MKKVTLSGKKVSRPSHAKVPSSSIDTGSASSIKKDVEVYVPRNNRWNVELKKGQMISDTQITSDVRISSDIVSENTNSRTAASQTSANRFQETRVMSVVELRKRAIAALKLQEQKRKKLLEQELEEDI